MLYVQCHKLRYGIMVDRRGEENKNTGIQLRNTKNDNRIHSSHKIRINNPNNKKEENVEHLLY